MATRWLTVAVQPGSGEHMRFDQRAQRFQQLGLRAHLVCQGGQAEVHAFPGIAIGLAVQRLMLTVFLVDDHRQQASVVAARSARSF